MTPAPAGMRGGRRALIGTGVLIMGFAVGGALTDDAARRIGVLVFLVAAVAAHDLVFLPLVLAAGALIRRFAPARWRAAVQAAGITGLALAVVGLPLALGFGRPPDNPSALPLAYGRNLLLMEIGVGVATFVIRKGWAARRRRRGR